MTFSTKFDIALAAGLIALFVLALGLEYWRKRKISIIEFSFLLIVLVFIWLLCRPLR